MRAYIFYSNGDQTETEATQLSQELDRVGVEASALDADGVDGSRVAELYDVTSRPSVVVAQDDGQMVHRWLGHLPPASDISYYVYA